MERVRRDEGHRHRLEAPHHHGPAVREVVRGRARTACSRSSRRRAATPRLLAADLPAELDHPARAASSSTTTSLTAGVRLAVDRAASVQSSTTRIVARERAAERRPRGWSPSTLVRNPTRPKLTPKTGVAGRRGRAERAQHRAVAAEDEERGRPRRPRPRRPRPRRPGAQALERARRSAAGDPSRATARVAITADPADGLVAVLGRAAARWRKNSRLPFGPRRPESAISPTSVRAPLWHLRGELAEHPAVHGRVAHDAALAHVRRAGLELRLHERERPPARRRAGERGRERLGERR